MENKNSFRLVHLNKDEGDILDDLQGGRSDCEGSNVRRYDDLERHIQELEPQLKDMIEHHARGGSINGIYKQIEECAKRGRNGDDEMVLMGPKTRACFNKMIGGKSPNPHTGRDEFWGLGRLWKGVKKVARGAVKTATDVAGQAVGQVAALGAPKQPAQPQQPAQPVQEQSPQPIIEPKKINPQTGLPMNRGGLCKKTARELTASYLKNNPTY